MGRRRGRDRAASTGTTTSVLLNDGTEVIGTIMKETDDELTLQPKDSRRRRAIKIGRRRWRLSTVPGRPMLVGTTNVNQSEKLSAALLKRRHQARTAQRQAGVRGPGKPRSSPRWRAARSSVTIATNMAGPRHPEHHPGRQPRIPGLGPPPRTSTPPVSTCRRRSGRPLVDDIKAKETMEQEGRAVAEMERLAHHRHGTAC